MHEASTTSSGATCVRLPWNRARHPVALPGLSAVALCLAGLPHLASATVFQVGTSGVFAPSPISRGGVLEVGADTEGDDAQAAEAMPDVPTTALTTIGEPIVPIAYKAPLALAANTSKVSPFLLAALVWRESRWRPGALSTKGARGLTQLMPATARALAVDPADAGANLAGGARYLRRMLDLFDGNVERALAAYNAGPGRVRSSRTYLPAITETRAYVSSIIDRLGDGVATTFGDVR